MDNRVAALVALTLLGSACEPLLVDKTSEVDQLDIDIDLDAVAADSLVNPFDHAARASTHSAALTCRSAATSSSAS